MFHRLLLLLPIAFLLASASEGQAQIPLFQAKLPGGAYTVAVRAIISVSTHEYVVDGAARVTEVNIDTAGSLAVRFYFIEPTTPNLGGVGAASIEKVQQIASDLGERTGEDVWKKVVKSYPTTTHARTVEYRVAQKEHLTRIFQAADEALRLQLARSVTVP